MQEDSLPAEPQGKPKNIEVGSLSLLQQIFPTQKSNQVSCIAGSSLPAEPQGKPKNTGVGSLSLLQQIFPTQELNRGLLHCRRILYQLSHQGSLKFESESESPSVVSDSLRPHGLYSPWNSLGQNTGVSTLSLLQGIFPTQG